jgi:hypothetical protein
MNRSHSKPNAMSPIAHIAVELANVLLLELPVDAVLLVGTVPRPYPIEGAIVTGEAEGTAEIPPP